MEEILCCIGAAIFGILACICGVRNRIKNSRIGTRRDIRNSRERLDNTLHNYKRTERDKEQLQELDKRDDGNIERCKDISSRLRKREQEADITE